MKAIKLALVVACCLGACYSAGAQTVAAVDEQGKQVRRITFDRERVTIEYASGEVRDNVDRALILRGDVTAIDAIKTQPGENGTVRQVYDLQGHRMVDVNNLPQGIYVVREGDKVYKMIKK